MYYFADPLAKQLFMKDIYYLMLCFLCSSVALAQLGTEAPWMLELEQQKNDVITYDDVVRAGEAYFETHDGSVKGSGLKPFYRWVDSQEAFVKADGTIQSPFELQQIVNQRNSGFVAKSDQSSWMPLGPFAHTATSSWSPGQARVNTMIVDPNDANIYYVGTPGGGLWKSSDAGQTWTPLTDYLAQIGVSSIAIDPTDSDVIYIGTGDRAAGHTYSIGMMKSTDGGISFFATGLTFTSSGEDISEIYIDPRNSNTLYIASSDGFYKSTNGGLTVQQTLPYDVSDIKLKPGSPDTIYAVTDSGLWKSSDGGDNWNIMVNGIPASNGRVVLAVTPADPNYVYALRSATNGSFGGVYRSTDSGSSWSRRDNGQDIYQSPQSWYDLAFEVSPTDKNRLLTGCLNVWQSSDGGASFTQLNAWNVPSQGSYTHADIHQIRAFNGQFFVSSDGGIYRSNSLTSLSFTDLTDGIQAGQFYRIAVAPSSSAKLVGGLQDNGAYGRTSGTWYNFMGADGMDGGINPNNENEYYSFLQNGGGLYISYTGGLNRTGYIQGPTSGNWITPLVTDRNGIIYAGYDRLYEVQGNSFVAKSSSFGSNIDVLEIDPNDDNVIYAAVNNSLYKSTNAGASFNSVGSSYPENITSIEVDHENGDRIYISTRFSTGQVFISEDGGLTRTDITYNLPNIGKNDIADQPQSSDGAIFIGTTLGVYRLAYGSTTWETYMNNLPNVNVRDLEINPNDNIITAGTFGRGIWQSGLSFSQPATEIALVNLSGNDTGLSCGTSGITINVENQGTTQISQIDVDYVLNGVSGNTTINQSIASGNTASVSISGLNLQVGANQFTATISTPGDTFNSNNYKSETILSNTVGMINTLYDLENQDLLTTGSGSSSVWERGAPSGSLLNSATSGTQVYGTNLDGNYPDNTVGFLYSGCYDLDGYNNLSVSFDMAYDLEFEWDIITMQYSTDGGSSWNILGSATDPNWFNNSATSGQSNRCFNCVGAQWTGTDAVMKEYSYDLDQLGNVGDILFRFAFISDQAVNQEGIIIDDFEVVGTLGNETVVLQNKVTVYPNPSSSVFNLSVGGATKTDYQVYDLSGKLIRQEKGMTDSIISIDLSDVSAGVYVLRGEVDGVRFARKLIRK